MEEDQQEPKTENTATPASNQNLILGIVMGAVVLLLVLLVISQQVGDNGDGENSETAKLLQKLEEQKAAMEKRRLASLTGVAANPESLVTQIKADTDALARLVNTSQGDAAALRTARSDASALARSNQELTTQLAQYRTAAQRAESLQRQLEQERQARAGMVDQNQVTQLRSELDLSQSEVDRLQSEMQKLRSQQSGMIDPNTYALLKSELDEMRKSNTALRIENQRLISELAGAKLFVSQEDLSPRAVALYRELKQLEDQDHRKRRDAYAELQNRIKATVQESIAFKTGSATIAREHEAHLKDMAVQANENSFFLVVGYASTTGDSLSNEELSSKRATRVASMVNYLKKEGQAVQAVYLGEGTRFGPENAPNQVCEVWEIRP